MFIPVLLMEVIKGILLSLLLSICSMTWCYSCHFCSDGATVIAVSLIRPNTKPPPGTETPIKGTIKMIQVENSVFLLSLRFPCLFPFLMMERVPFTVCISSMRILLITFHLHSLQMKCILFTKNIWRPYAIHTRIAYYLVKYHHYDRHHQRYQPLRLFL